MNWVYKLFRYTYISHCQGTVDSNEGYALLHVPIDDTFNDNRATLFKGRNKNYDHEVDIKSIEDCTVNF